MRPRYLGVEVAGEHLFPPSLRWWEATLRGRLDRTPAADAPFRIIRAEGCRAIVEVDHRRAPLARTVWNGALTDPPATQLTTVRAWGTLVGAKAWLRRRAPK